MRILHWNCQGLGSPLTVPHLQDIRKVHQPDIIFLIETKNVDNVVYKLVKDLGYEHSFVVSAKGSSGGLVIMWNDRVKINFLGNPTLNATDMHVVDGCNVFCLTYIYGHPVLKYRHELWEKLISNSAAGLYQNRPRLMLGDFNDIKDNSEKEGGVRRSEASFSLFRTLISVAGVHDLKTIGGFHTWNGNRSKYNIRTRIDRAMASCEWLDLYPTAHVKLLPWIGSDHKPLLVDTESIKCNKKKQFRYDNRWRLEPQIKKIIREVWQSDCSNLPPQLFYRVLEKCRNALSRWRSQNPRNTERRIHQLKQEIEQAYQSIDIDYTHINMLKTELSLQYRLEEEYWRTKSRVQWLQAGDRNTRFFHSKTKQRRSNNRIIYISDEEGKTYTEVKDIHSQILKYFQDLYRSEGTTIDQQLLDGIPTTITEEINDILTQEVTEKEIEDAAYAINPDKSPGPDGMNAGFFRHYWSIIKQGVISHVKYFFEHSQIHPKINHTHICLIPKTDSPNTVKDYRPISLSNVAYKIISKILAERLKPWLNGAISENQSAFIPGRLITDNVLIAHELIHSLHTKNLKTKYMALKLDISKAFDKVEWGFIIAVMKQMGFCETWCRWILTCMSTVTYSVLVNGESSKPIIPSRGIRQGDPISPYLYIICTEGLSALIKRNIRLQHLHGYKASRGGPAISHLFFADDSLVFCKASEDECKTLMQALNEYQKASGQAVNFAKSAITFAKGIPQNTQESLIKITGITKIGGFGKYLGLPEKIGRRRKDAFEYIKQRVLNRIDSWYNRFLSPAGREVLLKAVITALPTYAMSCFMLPKGLLNEITSSMRNFWWSGQKDRQKISWISWKKITASKREGGLGIRDMEMFNLALLAKQGWRIIKNPSSLLARVMKAKYFRHTDLLQAPNYKTSSYAWRSILQSRFLLQQGIKWIVGDGRKIRVWEDRWIYTQPARPALGSGKDALPHLKVHDLMIEESKEWNEQFINRIIRQEDAHHILNIRLSSTKCQDTPIWSFTRTGEYTVKSGYHLCNQIRNHQNSERQGSWSLSEDMKNICSGIWTLTIPPKIKTFWWRILHDGLPVAENLRKRSIKVDSTCQMCGEHPETQLHLLFHCRVTKEIWSLVPTSFSRVKEVRADIHQNVKDLIALAKTDKRELLNFYIGWRVWKKRNNLIFQQKRDHIVKVIHDAIRDKGQWEEANATLNKQDEEEERIKENSQPDQQAVPAGAQYYCQVDASWKNDKEVAGVGWSLHSIQGNQLLQGSSSIHATNTPREAETEAMRMAVRQMRALAFSQVHFISDCKTLVDELAQHLSGATIVKVRNTESLSMIQDIVTASKETGYTFSYIARNRLSLVDDLAKKARCNNQKYVITWF